MLNHLAKMRKQLDLLYRSIRNEQRSNEEKLHKFFEMNAKNAPPEFVTLFKEAYEFRQTLTLETDRGCALMAASFLEEELKLLLKKTLVQDEKVLGVIFEFNGALGTFSSRIEMAYLLGLISNTARKDLHTIRKIRNEFAHSSSPIDFKADKLQSLCINFVHDGLPKTDPALKKFRRATFGLLALIQTSRLTTPSIMAKKETDIDQLVKNRDKLMKDFENEL